MIKSLVDRVATSLVTLNSTWLTQVRTLGYLNRRPEGDFITTDGITGIGITDTRINSGYIRFKSDTNFTVSDLPESERRTSCGAIGQRISLDLRLVLVVQDSTPEDVVFYLTAQMNSLTFTEAEFVNRNVKVRASSAGSNTLSNFKTETGHDDTNNTFRVVFIDFKIYFDWVQNCDNTNIVIEMDNCINTDFLNIGCVQVCDSVTLYQNADYTGQMLLKTQFNGYEVTQTFSVTHGEPIVVPMENLNADYEYVIRLVNPSTGDYIVILSNDPTPTEHESFKVKVTP